MFPIPQIQIHQQYARLEFKAEPATLNIEQPQATIEMHTKQPVMHVNMMPTGELKIDQSRAWDAMGNGGVLQTNKRVADQMQGLANAAISKIVQDGNRMASIHIHENAIAELAWKNAFEPLVKIEYMGEPSYLNVDEEYIPHNTPNEFESGKVDFQATPNRPVIESRRGAFEAYLAQRNYVEITPPVIDQRL
ncbi:DUF6470 family protein [Paenibacillus alginolyticus]|uniref:DUF6470 family protein n=1 Tax=Paenibacillus alginolyticus TaxID=59839 RepID=A0ABT4GJB3_9BACL|nr:DUF6470 family protein [Paenibacillus alginolyticus]MCY9696123.1 DUF6470 family protein [Paenibacillus alginolyticus]MEC0143015.1 DUF6470 family protein [Paenibacillus alginolyticus]